MVLVHIPSGASSPTIRPDTYNTSPAVQANTRYALGIPIEPILDKLPETVTRKMAFDRLERLTDRPTYVNRIKMKLGEPGCR
jgi:hypothetical protein